MGRKINIQQTTNSVVIQLNSVDVKEKKNEKITT